MEPITRIEQLLSAINGGENVTPSPITRLEMMLTSILNHTVVTLKPITRIEMYLAKISGASVSIPDHAITRIEMYLAKIAGEDIETPAPITRLEHYLSEWAAGGDAGELVTVTGLSPIALANALAKPIKSLIQYGKVVQSGTPTPDAPVWPSINNGVVKAWTAREIPLAIDTDETGLINKDTGAVDANSSYRITEPIFVSAGDYNVKVTFATTQSARVFRIYAYSEDGTPLYLCVTATQKAGAQVYPFTISADCYIRVNYRYAGNSDISVEAVTPIVYVDGTPEVLTVGTQTATVPDLYAVGDYKDEAEIIGGGVTRKVGMKVLDGTEAWYAVTNYTDIYGLAVADGIFTVNQLCVSTHYAGTNATNANMVSGTTKAVHASVLAPGKISVYIKDTANGTSLAAWKAYLAAQYAAGTPVIVWYPLATETTETVTPQSLTLAAGDNTVSVTSNVDPVELAAEYVAKG